MTAAWTTIAALAVATAAIKGIGPVALGGRDLPPLALRLITYVAPALLGALVVVETFGRGKDLALDARAVGLAAAAAALAARLSVLWVVGVAAATAALVRAIS
ncbi:MAG TPA: AzlD domain-containing protein [Thermoleophilaceae bacterium]